MKKLIIPFILAASVAHAQPELVATSIDSSWYIDTDMMHVGDTFIISTIQRYTKGESDFAVVAIKKSDCKRRGGKFELNFQNYGYPEMIDFNLKKPKFVSDLLAARICGVQS